MKLHGTHLENYLLGLKREDSKEHKEVNVRKNNANSKWLKLTATSGRNPAWYKTIGMISFLNYTNKEAVVFFRVMSGQFAGGKVGKVSGQNGSVGFQISPGKWYLDNKDSSWTCLLGEFVNAIDELGDMLPNEFKELATQFVKLDLQKENALNLGREVWKEIYSKISRYTDLKDVDVLKGIDNYMKKAINKSVFLRKIKKGKKVIDFANMENIINYVTSRAKMVAGKKLDDSLIKNTGRSFSQHIDSYKNKPLVKGLRKVAKSKIGKTAIKFAII